MAMGKLKITNVNKLVKIPLILPGVKPGSNSVTNLSQTEQISTSLCLFCFWQFFWWQSFSHDDEEKEDKRWFREGCYLQHPVPQFCSGAADPGHLSAASYSKIQPASVSRIWSLLLLSILPYDFHFGVTTEINLLLVNVSALRATSAKIGGRSRCASLWDPSTLI